ncbi:uncharacterized protein [Littorina saxatilis]|uniref:C2H2-type domain-containing protein n=1 Tax=Littorina saxatilis TaxID=31220 RepID=A0AAN9G824_9CAEN
MEFNVDRAWKKGRRIVDVFHLANQMDCTQCKGLLDLRRTRRETRVGLASVLDILCSCGNVNRVHTDRRFKTENRDDAYVVNTLISSSKYLQMLKMAPADLQHFLDMFCIPVTLPINAVTNSSTPSPAAASMTPSDGSGKKPVTPGGIQSGVSSSDPRHHSNQSQVSSLSERAENIVASSERTVSQKGESMLNAPNAPEVTLTSQSKTSNDLPQEYFQVLKPELLHLELEENDCFGHDSDSKYATELSQNAQNVQVNQHEERPVKSLQTLAIKSSAHPGCEERDGHPVLKNKSEDTHCNGDMTTSVSDMMPSDTSVTVRDVSVSFGGSDVPVSVSVSDVPVSVKTTPTQLAFWKMYKKSCKWQRYKMAKDMPLEGMIQTFPVAAANDEPGGSQSTSCNDSTPKKRFQCRACNKRFKSELKAYAHVTCHTGSPYLRCFRCGKEFNGIRRHCNIAVLEGHLNQHDNVRPFVCEVCANTFQSARQHSQHMKEVHNYRGGAPVPQDSSLSCQQCSFRATSRSKLTAHSKVHTTKRQRICDVCGLILSSQISLRSHKNRRHDKRADEYHMACHLCEKRFRVREDLRCHLRWHKKGDVRGYQCEFCPKAFKTKKHLNTHERIHTGEKPFKCQLCEAAFVQKTSLDWHMKKHGAVK